MKERARNRKKNREKSFEMLNDRKKKKRISACALMLYAILTILKLLKFLGRSCVEMLYGGS